MLHTEDYIVEQGVSDIWTYRKWASGIAECWGKFERENVSTTEFKEWGNMYSVEIKQLPSKPTLDDRRFLYPFEFIGKPYEIVNVGSSELALLPYTFSNGTPTTTASGAYKACRPDTIANNISSTTIELNIYTIGKWKQGE